MARLVKYMGSADARVLSRGENFAGRLQEPLSKELRWDRDNHFIVDLKEAGVSNEAAELILEDATFKDVTDLKRVPSNDNEVLFLGLPKTVQEDEIEEKATEAQSKKSSSGAGGRGGSGTTTGGTTAGGSTRGGAGGGTAGGT